MLSSTYSTPWRPSATSSFNNIVNSTWTGRGNFTEPLPDCSSADERVKQDVLGHAVLASAAHWLSGDALNGIRGVKKQPAPTERFQFQVRRPDPPKGALGSLSARGPGGSFIGQNGSMSARGSTAPVELPALRGPLPKQPDFSGPVSARMTNSWSAAKGPESQFHVANRVGDVTCPRWSDFGQTDQDRSTILKMMERKAGQKFKTVRQAFRFVDADRDGHVDLEEMRHFFRAYDFPAVVADRFFDHLDKDGKGEIDYDVFVRCFKPYVVRGVHGNLHAGVALDVDEMDQVAPTDDDEHAMHIDPSMRAELRSLMQDIGRQLPLKFKHPRNAFRVLDLERNGLITRQEMRGFFRGFGYPDDVADRVFDLLTEEETGAVNFSAFMKHFDQVVGPQFRQAKRKPLIPVEERRLQSRVDEVAKAIQERMTTKYKNVHQAFRDLDLNKDGSVDRHEMRVFLRKLGHEKLADMFFDALDDDGSGCITYDEFVALCGVTSTRKQFVQAEDMRPGGVGQPSWSRTPR